ncbi:hypothetical protein ACIQIG_21035 [Streptomyces bacillaris]
MPSIHRLSLSFSDWYRLFEISTVPRAPGVVSRAKYRPSRSSGD